jgi:hypothetical protein
MLSNNVVSFMKKVRIIIEFFPSECSEAYYSTPIL